MKSFSGFIKSTLLEFTEGPTIIPGFLIKPHKEKYMPGGNIKSKESVPLMSLQDFYSLEMHQGVNQIFFFKILLVVLIPKNLIQVISKLKTWGF